MSDGPAPFPPADEEEERAARALRQALEDRSGGPDVPDAALETAALLRFSSDAGRRSSERRAALRQELLATLPPARPRRERTGWRYWFGLGLPLVGGATAAVLLGVLGVRHWAAPEAAQRAERSVAAAPSAAAPSAAGELPSEQLERQSREYRALLLLKVADARVNAVYTELDRARSNTELESARTRLTALVSEPLGGTGEATDAELLRQDVFCRLSEVALRLGQAQAALDWAHRGLELDGAPNPFLARLFQLDGQARGALGDPDGAAKSYLKALEVNERLLDESLDSP